MTIRPRFGWLSWMVLSMAALGIALHAVSFTVLPYYTRIHAAGHTEVSLHRGWLWVYDTDWIGIGRGPQNGWRYPAFMGQEPSRRAWEQQYEDILADAGLVGTLVRIPLLTLCLPMFPWWLWRSLLVQWRTERAAAGLCGACGYDLRGAAGGRCSECGFRFRKSD